MELIVDGKNVLEPVNLEKNKNEIMQQRASVPSQISLTHFRENVGIFRANVKGDDVNGLVTELQKIFSDINTRETKMYDQLDTVFRTVESIHKGSIEGIIVGVKSAQEAISQAEYAISAISDTLAILQDFKNQLENNTEHLNDIDVIWDATQQLNSDIQGLEDTFLDKAESIDNNIKVLMSLKSMIDKIKHIKDIDTMYKDLSVLCQKLDQEKKKTSDNLSKISAGIQELEKFKESVEKIKHLRDADAVYSGLSELKDTVIANESATGKELCAIQSSLKELDDFRQDLEKSDHLYDVDTMWEENKKLIHSVEELENSTANHDQNIQSMTESIQHNADEIISLENEVSLLKGKMKVLYYALGGTIGVVVLQIILNMIGIL